MAASRGGGRSSGPGSVCGAGLVGGGAGRYTGPGWRMGSVFINYIKTFYFSNL